MRIQDIGFERVVVTVCQGEGQERPHSGAFGEWNFEKSLISAISVTAVRKPIPDICSSSEPLDLSIATTKNSEEASMPTTKSLINLDTVIQPFSFKMS